MEGLWRIAGVEEETQAAVNLTRGNVKNEKKEGNQESFFLFFIYEHLEFQFDQKCIF